MGDVFGNAAAISPALITAPLRAQFRRSLLRAAVGLPCVAVIAWLNVRSDRWNEDQAAAKGMVGLLLIAGLVGFFLIGGVVSARQTLELGQQPGHFVDAALFRNDYDVSRGGLLFWLRKDITEWWVAFYAIDDGSRQTQPLAVSVTAAEAKQLAHSQVVAVHGSLEVRSRVIVATGEHVIGPHRLATLPEGAEPIA
jgi:hypothetical protein